MPKIRTHEYGCSVCGVLYDSKDYSKHEANHVTTVVESNKDGGIDLVSLEESLDWSNQMVPKSVESSITMTLKRINSNSIQSNYGVV